MQTNGITAWIVVPNTIQKMTFSIKDFCEQIYMKLRIWSYLIQKFLMENFFITFFMQWKVYREKEHEKLYFWRSTYNLVY